MKEIIDTADALLAQAQRVAARRRTTLEALGEGGLREPTPLETHVVHGRGFQAGRSWDDLGGLIDSTYEGRGG